MHVIELQLAGTIHQDSEFEELRVMVTLTAFNNVDQHDHDQHYNTAERKQQQQDNTTNKNNTWTLQHT